MSRPTRNEALEALEDPRAFYVELRTSPHKAVGYKRFGILVEAARAYAAMALDTCPTCDGVGRTPATPDEQRMGATDPEFHQCPSCGGRGYVWPDQLARIWYCFVLDLGWQEGHETPGYDRVGLPDHCKQENHSECGWLVRLDALVEVDDHE